MSKYKDYIMQYNELQQRLAEFGFITQNDPLLCTLSSIDRIAKTDIAVVITGSSGTGKNLIAQYIHAHSARSGGPLVTLDVTCLSPNLVESELFGHEKGAFTSAISSHTGACERADGGILFLDEIGDLSIDLQKKLLRAIETKTITRVGATKDISLDFRVIAATNKNLKKMVRKRLFRKDLFFRLHESGVHLPSLRKRIDDIPLLCDYFIELFNEQLGKNVTTISDAAVSYLSKYHWPGNVRELRNVIKSAVALSGRDTLWVEDIPLHFSGQAKPQTTFGELMSLEELERGYVEYVLDSCKWNKSKAAKILDISRPRLHRLISRFALMPD